MNTKTKQIKVKEDLYIMLECPVCSEYMVAPIILCANGHSICSGCKSKFKNCPNCGQSYLNTRNFVAEHMSETLTFPCENSEFGCENTLFLSEKTDHERICPYRIYECVVSDSRVCKWQGRKAGILPHVEECHSSKVLTDGERIDFSFEISSFDKDLLRCEVICAHGELFLLWHCVKSIDKSYYNSVHYVGSRENCSRYLYDVSYSSPFGPEHKMSFRTETHPDYIKISQLVEEKECSCLGSKMAKHFMENDHLKFTVQIIKVN